jgi:peptide/nickel transport system ATP-binding protein
MHSILQSGESRELTRSSNDLLTVKGLTLEFHTFEGVARVLYDVGFSLAPNSWTGLVGETGCGKSVTASAVIRLLPPSARIVGGQIRFKGKELLSLSERELRPIRGAEISMVLQDPSVAVNPAFKVGYQIQETIMQHQSVGKRAATERAEHLMSEVGLERYILTQYPHELSGGMLQRVMIGLAVVCNPSLILADEPTSSLDVTVQKDILILMKELSLAHLTTVLLITHDLVLVAQTCHAVIVMYAGLVVERGSTEDILSKGFHPYTQALIRAIPVIERKRKVLEEIPGNVPNLFQRPKGCPFFARCTVRIPGRCDEITPAEIEISPGHFVRCHHAYEA